MNDIEVINRFKEMISWADETELMEYGDRIFLVTALCVYVPSKWNEIDMSDLLSLKNIRDRVTVLVWGNPSDEETVKTYLGCIENGLHSYFLDPNASIAYSGFVMPALDGVDWNRTFANAAQHGFNAKPVYEWDK